MTSPDPGGRPPKTWPKIVLRGFKPEHPKVTEERIKARAQALQNLGLAILGLSVLAPIFTEPARVNMVVVVGGALMAGFLFVVSQAILGYLPNPNPAPKEDDHNGHG